MKHFKILILSIFCLTNTLSAQEKPLHIPTNVIKVNLLGVGIGGFSVAYERTISPVISLAGTGRFMFYDFEDTQSFTFDIIGTIDIDYEIDFELIGFLPEGRFYLYSLFEKDAPAGLFLSPYLGFTRAAINVKSLNKNFTLGGGTSAFFFELGGSLGYQFVIGDRVTLDFFGGLGFTSFTLDSFKVEVASTISNETINDLLQFGKRLPLGITLTGAFPRFGASIGVAF